MENLTIKLFILGIIFLAADGPVLTRMDDAPSYYRSAKSGEWHAADTWHGSATEAGPWNTVKTVPDHKAAKITIQHGHTVEIKSVANMTNVFADGVLKITDGGQINIYKGLEHDIQVGRTGTLQMESQKNYAQVVSVQYSAATYDTYIIDIQPGGKIIIGEKATGNGYDTLATSPKNRWGNGSMFIWNNGEAFKTSGATYFPVRLQDGIPKFIISKTITSHPLNGVGNNLIVNGLFVLQSDLVLAGGGKKIFKNGISGTATLTQDSSIQTPGSFEIGGNSAILGGKNLKIILATPLNLLSSITVPKDSTAIIIDNNLNNSVSGNLLRIEGTLDITDQRIVNEQGGVIIARTGKYRTRHPGGFTGAGSSIPGGNVTLENGSMVELYAHADQTLKSRNDFSNLIFSGSGVKRPSSAFAPVGTITIKEEAILDCLTPGGLNVNVGGDSTNLIMTGGKLIVRNTGLQPAMGGSYLLSGGRIEFANKNTTHQTIRSESYNNIEITGPRIKNSRGKITIIQDGSFIVKSGGIYSSESGNAPIVGPNDLPQNQRLVVEPGGVFRTAVASGFYGPRTTTSGTSPSVQSSIPIIDLQKGSTVEYSRSTLLTDDTEEFPNGHQIITISENFNYQNLVLSGNGNKSAPNADLKIAGHLTVKDNAVFSHNKSSVIFNLGETTPEAAYDDHQNIEGSSPIIFHNLENGSGGILNVRSDISIKNELLLHDSTRLHLHDGDITITSDKDGTGRVAKIPPHAKIFYETNGGRFKIERYIPRHPKAWQLLSANTSDGTIKESWQNNKESTMGRGVNITAPFADDWEKRGFDAYSPAPSMKYYNPETNLFAGITSTDLILNAHPAYFLFVRGDRTVSDVNQAATEVTLHSRGKLYAPDNMPPSVAIKPGQFAMLGNPYASPIEYDRLPQMSTAGGALQTSYYIWDPNLTAGKHSQYGLGGYRTITYVEGIGYEVAPLDSNYLDTEYPPLQSGQGFFVYNPSQKTVTIHFPDSIKVTASANVFRNAASTPAVSKISADLYVREKDHDVLLDGTLRLFNSEYSAEIDELDAKKMMNSTENISLPSEKYPLIIERRPFPKEGDTLFYHLTGLSKRNYALKISTTQMLMGQHDVYVHDAYEQTATLLEDGKTILNFAVDGHAASSKADRFYLTFKKTILPFAFNHEKALATSEKIRITWAGANQSTVSNFILEHSVDGISFRAFHHLPPTLTDHDTYEIAQEYPTAGMNYYRIKAVMKDGSHVYSQILNALIDYSAPSIAAFPNPVKGVLQLDFYRQPEGNYKVTLMSAEGRTILIKKIQHSGFKITHKIVLPAATAAGLYQLQIATPAGEVRTEKILVH